MEFCYKIFLNYGIAIILFTIISKIVLLPISIWVQKNSIKMVKMQPDINKIKIKFFGDKEKIADEESKLYKKHKYSPFASIIPLAVQLLLLIGLIAVINKPMTYIMGIDKKVSDEFVSVALDKNNDLDEDSTSLEISVVKDIEKNGPTKYENLKEVIGEKEFEVDTKKIQSLNMDFFGFNLSWIAAEEGGIAYLIPLIAGLSALILCIAQNIMNVLQAEQSKLNKYGMLILSVGLSLYLGVFVPAGVALYWTASNLLAILQQWLLNIFIDPKKHVDYDELDKTNAELKKLQSKGKQKRSKKQIQKEKEDYKKFFKIVNKHLVFYSESNGFYKYYKGIIEYILNNTNLTIHYITSDYNDNIFNLEKENPQIKAYYIEERKLITMMMKMDADVVAMTMPDIENYHIKRSYIRKDIEYVYIQHGMDSVNLAMRTGSMDHYDTVFVTGKHQKQEALKQNEIYNLKDRKIFEWGYCLLDDMILEYKKNKKENKTKTILIAPSWQDDNIVDLCLDELLENLKNSNYDIIVRPHPQQVRHEAERFNQMKKYYENTNITIQTDFSSNDTVFNSDILITDWSSIAQEFAFATKKPVIFIDTPMKIMNPEYKKLGIEPFNIWAREEMGKLIKLDDLNRINSVIDDMVKNKKKYQKKIENLVKEYVYNLGKSSEVGAEYIIGVIQDKIKERKKK